MKHRRYMAATALALPLALGAPYAQAADIVQTLRDSGEFSTLVDAIEQAGLAETLQGEGPFTVFAPTDAAFENLPQGVRDSLMQQGNTDQLEQILNHHVVEGEELMASDIQGQERQVDAASGDRLTVDGTGTMVVLVPTGLSVARIGDEVFVRREVAAITTPAVTVSPTTGQEQGQQAQQGQQQQIQQGEQPQQGQQQATAAQAGDEQGQPIGEQRDLLRAAMVVQPDIEADNGVIHGIDQVLIPQKLEQQLTQAQGQQQQGQGQGQQQGQQGQGTQQ